MFQYEGVENVCRYNNEKGKWLFEPLALILMRKQLHGYCHCLPSILFTSYKTGKSVLPVESF